MTIRARYVAIPLRAWGSETEFGWQDRPTCQVVESDPAPVSTGLLDATGTPLYRVNERIPIGFHNRTMEPPNG